MGLSLSQRLGALVVAAFAVVFTRLPWLVSRLFNPLMRRLLTTPVPVGPNALLTVRGRRNAGRVHRLGRAPAPLRAAPTGCSARAHAGRGGHRGQLPAGEHLVDEAVVFRFLGAHDEVAVGVAPDPVDRLAGVVGQDL